MSEEPTRDLRDLERELCVRFLPTARLFFVRHGAASESEDLAHEALVVTLEALRDGRVRDPARAGGFLLGVCRNLVRDRARHEQRTQRAYARLETGAASSAPTDDRIKLWRCLNALPARAREVVVRSYVEEHETDEVARAMATTAGNVRVLRHRSLGLLLACLSERSAP